MIAAILGAASSLKVAYATAFALVATGGGWGAALLAQVDGSDAAVGTLIPAAALTGTSGALVWVVKQIVGGNLVHRDPAVGAAKLAEALDAVTSVSEKALERERILTDLLVEKRRRDLDETND